MSVSYCAEQLRSKGLISDEIASGTIRRAHTYIKEGMEPMEAGKIASKLDLQEAYASRKKLVLTIEKAGGSVPKRTVTRS